MFNRKVLDDDSTIPLFPYGLISQNHENTISTKLAIDLKTGVSPEEKASQIEESTGSLKNSDNYEFVLGRFFIPNSDAVSIMQELTNGVEIFYGGKPLVDDYTLLIIQKTARA